MYSTRKTEETEYEFGLILPEKYQNGIYLFNQSVPTIDDGLNGTVPEKIRRFNNAASHLVRSILAVEQTSVDGVPILQLCKDADSVYDTIYRQLIRNVYMELFIYQEKLLNIVCNIFFLKISTSKKKNLAGLEMRSADFPLLCNFCKQCNQLIKDEKYQRVMSIRDDETHNMSQIDSFVLDLEKIGEGLRIVNKGYRIQAETLRAEYIYVMERLLQVRNLVQEMLDTYDLREIYIKLQNQSEEIYVN
jgi:hypothetical protein